jgi:hypothetical protein
MADPASAAHDRHLGTGTNRVQHTEAATMTATAAGLGTSLVTES